MENITKEFIKFLKSKRLYSKFKRNALKHIDDGINSETCDKVFDRFLNHWDIAEINPVIRAFQWAYSPEGYNFWKQIADLWEAHKKTL